MGTSFHALPINEYGTPWGVVASKATRAGSTPTPYAICSPDAIHRILALVLQGGASSLADVGLVWGTLEAPPFLPLGMMRLRQKVRRSGRTFWSRVRLPASPPGWSFKPCPGLIGHA